MAEAVRKENMFMCNFGFGSDFEAENSSATWTYFSQYTTNQILRAVYRPQNLDRI